MGNYADYEDVYKVAARLSQGSTPVVSTADIDETIEWIEAEVDAGLEDCGYTVPLTNARDIKTLKRLIAQKAAQVNWSNFIQAEENDFITRYADEYTRMMDKIYNCSFPLSSTIDEDSTTTTMIGVGSFTLHSDMRFADDDEDLDDLADE